MNDQSSTSILFVCMGNICRSPTAEGVFRKVVEDAGLADRIRVDSAGTHAYHTGEPPDRRAQAAATSRGYVLADIRARRVRDEDFVEFDYIIAMDEDNLAHLQESVTEDASSSLRLFLEFTESHEREVPDPYYGGTSGFERVLDLVEEASRGLLEHIRGS
jgi:low molecular weight protein-tyrosine phosphatase